MQANAPATNRSDDEIRAALLGLFANKKAEGCAADFLGQCSRDEMPAHVVKVVADIKAAMEPKPEPPPADDPEGGAQQEAPVADV